MATYVYSKELGIMVDKETGLPMLNQFERSKPLQTPMTVPDIEPYLSPVSGEYVSGRRAKADDLKKHNCVDANDLPKKTDGKLRSEKLIKKYKLPRSMLKDA
jgi:hypothetical protein